MLNARVLAWCIAASSIAERTRQRRENSPVVDEVPIEHQHGYISDKQAYLRRMSRI
ncbi:hypothetical protein [Dietzia sp. CQ4]|uniref:hypothetical protein n=1 Tax=Dietzia sp. (strain CQ4) TaxID=370437 RepID=UPI001F50698A|nr:hypothetical protein [Dietzia sp. CQ4]